jgi:cob(I)alamin adenosyltransferase
MAIAVADDRGDIISFVRMDGARPRFGEMAIKKAYTSAYNGRDTRKALEMRQKWDWGAYEPVGNDFTVIPGGLAIVKPGEAVVYGGIGTSGRAADEDEALALVGLKALQDFLWPSL